MIKFIKYFFYMISLRVKGLKYERIKRKEGIEKAVDYAHECMYEWSKFTVDTIGIDIVVKGKENIPEEPCLFIGNHTSILDIPVMACAVDRKIGFVSKKEILKVPVLGYWLLKARCISLDRENPRDAVRMINEGVKNLKDGYSMVIFPEGTRSKDGKPLPFKKGSVKLGTKAKAPIVPVTIDAAFLSFEKDKKFKPSTITVTFGKAIDTKNLTKEEEKSLTDNIRETIVSNLRDEFKA